MKILILLIFTSSTLTFIECKNSTILYYWKNYNGTIPEDALAVRVRHTDRVVYVGQADIENVGLLPGMLEAGTTEMEIVINQKVVTADESIKILCTKDPQNFLWISTASDGLGRMARLGNIKVVIGGHEHGTNFHIGRYIESGYANIGKIYTGGPQRGLVVIDENGKVAIHKYFEVLVYFES